MRSRANAPLRWPNLLFERQKRRRSGANAALCKLQGGEGPSGWNGKFLLRPAVGAGQRAGRRPVRPAAAAAGGDLPVQRAPGGRAGGGAAHVRVRGRGRAAARLGRLHRPPDRPAGGKPRAAAATARTAEGGHGRKQGGWYMKKQTNTDLRRALREQRAAYEELLGLSGAILAALCVRCGDGATLRLPKQAVHDALETYEFAAAADGEDYVLSYRERAT